MRVVSNQAFISRSGSRRGRICQRGDGRWQYVTECLSDETEELLSYWIPDYPPSGLYDREQDAVDGLEAALGGMTPIEPVSQSSFDVGVGPYPDLQPS